MDLNLAKGALQDEDTVDIPACSLIDCQLPTDIVLESCDGVHYGAHRVNLEAYSAGFPPAASTQFGGEIVHMPENSKVLGLLLHYMHNERQPDSSNITFEVMAPLSEAVEKYMVFSAMEVCKIRMQEAIPHHPLDVLAYAVKHGYPQLTKIAAPLTLSVSLDNVSRTVKDRPDIILKWVEYREHWLNLRNFIFESPPTVPHRGGISSCEHWVEFHRQVLLESGAKIITLQQFNDILQRERERYLDECIQCQIRVGNWKGAFKKRLAAMTSFDESI